MRGFGLVAAAAVVLLLDARENVYAIDFHAESAKDSPLGGVVAGVDDGAVTVPAAPAVTPTPRLIKFEDAGSLDAGTVDVNDSGSSSQAGDASSATRNGTDRYAVVPPSSEVDLQGFPFLSSPVIAIMSDAESTSLSPNATAMTAAVALQEESDEWIKRVCSGRKTSCSALQPAVRRLTDDTSVDTTAMEKSIDLFIAGLVASSATEILTEVIESGLMLGFAMAFSFVLEFALPSFADQWEEVTSKLKQQADAVLAVANKAATDMSFINERGYLLAANQKAHAFAIQRMSYKTDLSVLCSQDGGAEAHLSTYFSNARRYRESLKVYCGAKRDCVVTGGALYAKSMGQALSNALTCIFHRDRDAQKLKTRGKELQDRVAKTVADFLNDSEIVRDKIITSSGDDPNVKTIDTLFAKLLTKDKKGAKEYTDSVIAKSFDWLDFAVVVSDSTSTSCDRDYKYKPYSASKHDKGVGMLVSFTTKKTIVLAWKQRGQDDAKLVDEVLMSSKAADARSDELKSQCGDTMSGMVLVSVHGDSVTTKSRNPFEGAMRRTRARRRLAESYDCSGGYRLVAVCGKTYQNTTYDASPITFDETPIDDIIKAGSEGTGAGTDLNPQVVSDYFNTYADDQKSLQDLVTDFGTEEWVRGMALRDPAVLAYAELGLGLINEVTELEVKQIDHIDGVLDQTHQAQVTALNGVNNKLIDTHGKEMTGLKTMENDMTKYHREEIKMYDSIDAHVAELDGTITQGFANANSKVSSVEAGVSNKLSSLNDLIGSTAQETRQQVVSYLRETTQQTMSSLDSLEGHINKVDQKTLGGVGEVRDLIVETQSKLRENIANEFHKQELAFQSGVADASQLVEQVGQRVLYALLYDVDVVNKALTQQLDGIANHVDVVKGRLVEVEKGFADLQVQVDKMLQMLSTIQQRTNRIFRTLQNFPQKVAAILLQGEVKKRLDDFKKLNYAFTRFVENGMRPLYRSELIMACDDYSKAGDLLYYFTSNVGVEGGMDAVVKHFRKFEFNRGDYEKFGGQTVVAAYGVQRLSLTCAFLKEDLTRAQFIERATLWDKEIDAAMYRFQMNVEEVIPRYFLTQYYTPTVLQGYLADAKISAGVATSATSTSDFSLGAIEQLRYRIQQDIGVFASVSVIQVQDKNALRVWTKLSTLPDKNAQNRQGISMQLPNAAILWSNTKKEIPVDVRDLMKLTLKPEDVASAESLTAAFRNTVLEKYWAAGAIQTVVYTDKVAVAGSAKACPWAISSSHYPACWEVSNLNGGACACVQMEGLPDTLSATELTAKSLAPSFYTTKTSLTNADEPRSNFVITAGTMPAQSLTTSELLGVPNNRISFAACMSSPLPPVECNVTTATGGALCHQPPPQYKRCIADKANAYSIVYDVSAQPNATASFIDKGLTVTDEMFRTLELGATLPQISFFDEPNGVGNYVVCKNCVMSDFKTVFMFRIMSFKIGRPIQEKDVVCIPHPRLKNVEYCPRKDTRKVLWTSQVLVETELIKRVQQIGDGIAQGITDTQALASLINDGIQQLLNTDFAYFKVYVAKSGSFNASSNSGAYWTSLPTQEAAQERGWSVVPEFYTTVTDDEKVLAFDALIMWSTLPVETRNFAKLVVEKKPAGQSLKAYLQSAFSAYDQEKILRGYFSEPFDGLDCPVAGDTDHFAYCTPTPVDKTCLCIQLEDLPEEYTELYDGSAPNGKVVSFQLDAEQAAFVVGRTKGPFSLGSKVSVGTWDGFPMRNVSERSVCVSDYNHPELGATCVSDDGTRNGISELMPATPTASPAATSSGVVVGDGVEVVTIEAPTWSAQCNGCTGEFVTQILQEGGEYAAVRVGGYIGGGECRNALANGGGVLTMCLK